MMRRALFHSAVGGWCAAASAAQVIAGSWPFAIVNILLAAVNFGFVAIYAHAARRRQ